MAALSSNEPSKAARLSKGATNTVVDQDASRVRCAALCVRLLARVMRDSETHPERKAFWEQSAKTFDELYAKLVKLLEDEYFSP